MKITAIIPSRFASTRLPGKPLIKILNKPMIEWVYKSIAESKILDETIVATDDKRIFDTCKSFGAKVIMTGEHHKSGTDRIAEVAENIDSDLVINVQGDEPLMSDSLLKKLVDIMKNDLTLKMGSLARPLETGELENPNVVKVSIDEKGYAEYFMRRVESLKNKTYYSHIGIYAYKRDFLLQFTKLPPSDAEKEHKLEQLRAIDNGYKIGMALTTYKGLGVDTIEDLKKAENLLRERLKNYKSAL